MWNELLTTNPDKAKKFFSTVLGWKSRTMKMPQGSYTIWRADGKDAGGMMKFNPKDMGGAPPHWMSYVQVDDVDKRVAKVKKAGGKVVAQPFDVPGVGRIAVICDPTGAALGVMTPKG